MKKSRVVLIVLMIFGCSYVVLGYTGVIQSPFTTSPTYDDADELDITFLSAYVGDSIFSKIMDNADSLDVHVYGVDDKSAASMIAWYEIKNKKDGWEPFEQQKYWTQQSFFGGKLYSRVWNKYLKGQVVVTIDGSYIQDYIGYRTVVVTSSAPLYSYDQYIP